MYDSMIMSLTVKHVQKHAETLKKTPENFSRERKKINFAFSFGNPLHKGDNCNFQWMSLPVRIKVTAWEMRKS